jgi:hypothetical protein
MIGEYVVCRRDFKDYLDNDFYTAFQIWTRSSRYGLPCSGGWLEQPGSVIELIELFDGERDRLDRKEMKTRANNR